MCMGMGRIIEGFNCVVKFFVIFGGLEEVMVDFGVK